MKRHTAPAKAAVVSEEARLHEEKLAVRVGRVAEPYLKEVREDKMILGVINMAVAAWNLAVLEEEAQDEAYQKMVERIDGATSNPEEREAVLDWIQVLAERKMELYPDDRRVVAHHHLTFLVGGRFNLTCTSASPDPGPGPAVAAAAAAEPAPASAVAV